MSLNQLVEELVYMGFQPNKYSKMLNDSNGSSLRITVTGWNRFEKLSKREQRRIRSIKPRDSVIYFERKVFGITLWRVMID